MSMETDRTRAHGPFCNAYHRVGHSYTKEREGKSLSRSTVEPCRVLLRMTTVSFLRRGTVDRTITGRITKGLTNNLHYQYLTNGTVSRYTNIELTYVQYINILFK